MASCPRTDRSLDFTSQKSDTILMISEMSFYNESLASSGLENDKKFFIVCGALFSSCFYFQFLLFGYHADDELISDGISSKNVTQFGV